MSQQKLHLDIPPDLRPRQREELADLVIEHIVERTQSGKDKDGKQFKGYSKAYMKSLDFRNAGKSKKVDLQLSGDMLAAIELLREKNGSLTIGFQKGSEENERAEGNITGSYGREANSSKARDFLGIKSAKLRELIEFVRSRDG